MVSAHLRRRPRHILVLPGNEWAVQSGFGEKGIRLENFERLLRTSERSLEVVHGAEAVHHVDHPRCGS